MNLLRLNTLRRNKSVFFLKKMLTHFLSFVYKITIIFSTGRTSISKNNCFEYERAHSFTSTGSECDKIVSGKVRNVLLAHNNKHGESLEYKGSRGISLFLEKS